MRRWPLAFFVAGMAGLVLSALGWTREPAAFYPGWLAAVTLLAAWPLGSIGLLLIHATTGGSWGATIRPALRAGVFALPLLFLALLPLIPGMSTLYPWARPGGAAEFHNGFYLNLHFLSLRVAIYFVIWGTLGLLALRTRIFPGLAAAGLFGLAVTVSFAAIDSTMSLDPRFVSSIYGMLTGTGMVLLALSIAVMISVGTTPPAHRADLGKLLLALVVLWIYLDFMQLLIVWQSDLAHDAPWYDQRARGLWGAVQGCIAVGHFLLPFALLISPWLQRSPRVLRNVAMLLVAMEILRAWWTVLPSFGLFISWLDIACIVGLMALAAFVVTLAGGPRMARPLQHG